MTSSAPVPVTYQVEWISNIPGYDLSRDSTDVVQLYAVKLNGEKILIRSTSIATVRQLRAANRMQQSRTDLSVLTEGGLLDVIRQVGYDHCEMCILNQMPPKAPGAQTVEFPPSAFEQSGTTRGTSSR